MNRQWKPFCGWMERRCEGWRNIINGCRTDLDALLKEAFPSFRLISGKGKPTVWMPGFFRAEYGGIDGQIHVLAQETGEGSFKKLEIWRGAKDETIYLAMGAAYVSYLQTHWEVCPCTLHVPEDKYFSQLRPEPARWTGMKREIPRRYSVYSPWFSAENNRDSMEGALGELLAWYREQRAEIEASFAYQQQKIDEHYPDLALSGGM